jgi:stearoyl-CoA desaturase (delta-9 desaturase)
MSLKKNAPSTNLIMSMNNSHKSSTSSKKPPLNWRLFILLILPTAASLTLVPWYGLTVGYDSFEWSWFLALLIFCEISITAGYHRLWSHSAYKAHRILRFFFALGGACALQNDCLTWAADHRRHHRYADDNERDPYSAAKGLWYSHFEWMIRDWPSTREDLSNVEDLKKDPILRWQRQYYVLLSLFTNLGIPLMLGYLHGNMLASILLVGFLRLAISQHFTWLINSAAHAWGKMTYDLEQTARDNWFLAILTFGEGFHNYHHTFSWDYRNGIKWYHYDPTKWFIKICSWCKLAHNLRSCSAYRIELRKLHVQLLRARKKCDEQKSLPQQIKILVHQKLDTSYSELQQSLHDWANAQQQWYQARSTSIGQELKSDIRVLKNRYMVLKDRVQKHREKWQQILVAVHNHSLENQMILKSP